MRTHTAPRGGGIALPRPRTRPTPKERGTFFVTLAIPTPDAQAMEHELRAYLGRDCYDLRRLDGRAGELRVKLHVAQRGWLHLLQRWPERDSFLVIEGKGDR